MSTNETNGATGNGNKRNALSHWTNDPRWSGVTRPYSYSDVVRLRGSIQIEYTLARLGAAMESDAHGCFRARAWGHHRQPSH
jgi:isocitrate lyase